MTKQLTKINLDLTEKQYKLLEDLRNHVSSRTWEKAHDRTKTSLIRRKLVHTNPFSGNVEPTELACRILDGLPVYDEILEGRLLDHTRYGGTFWDAKLELVADGKCYLHISDEWWAFLQVEPEILELKECELRSHGLHYDVTAWKDYWVRNGWFILPYDPPTEPPVEIDKEALKKKIEEALNRRKAEQNKA